MGKIGDIKQPVKKPVPFLNDGKMRLTTLHDKNKITGFELDYEGEKVTFTVVKFNILDAWQKVEEYLKRKHEKANKRSGKKGNVLNARVKKK